MYVNQQLSSCLSVIVFLHKQEVSVCNLSSLKQTKDKGFVSVYTHMEVNTRMYNCFPKSIASPAVRQYF